MEDRPQPWLGFIVDSIAADSKLNRPRPSRMETLSMRQKPWRLPFQVRYAYAGSEAEACTKTNFGSGVASASDEDLAHLDSAESDRPVKHSVRDSIKQVCTISEKDEFGGATLDHDPSLDLASICFRKHPLRESNRFCPRTYQCQKILVFSPSTSDDHVTTSLREKALAMGSAWLADRKKCDLDAEPIGFTQDLTFSFMGFYVVNGCFHCPPVI